MSLLTSSPPRLMMLLRRGVRGRGAFEEGWSNGAGLEECFQFGGGFAAETRHLRQLLDGGQTQALEGAEFFQQCRLALLADAGELIEDAFGNPLEAQLGVIGVGKSMRFIAHPLQ